MRITTYLNNQPYGNEEVIQSGSLKCNVEDIEKLRRKVSFKGKLSIAKISNSSEVRLTEKRVKCRILEIYTKNDQSKNENLYYILIHTFGSLKDTTTGGGEPERAKVCIKVIHNLLLSYQNFVCFTPAS